MRDIDIDRIVRNSIDTVKGSGYTFHHKGKPDQSAQKGDVSKTFNLAVKRWKWQSVLMT